MCFNRTQSHTIAYNHTQLTAIATINNDRSGWYMIDKNSKRSDMAAAFTNQPRVTPIYNQQVASQLGNGNFSQFNQGMQPGMGGMQPGMGGMGVNGNIYPLGGGMMATTIYATVTSGQPIILDPKTGIPYPPGFIPEIQDPNTWEGWQLGDSWKETQTLADAKLAEMHRTAKEIAFRPGEEMVGNRVAKLKTDFGQGQIDLATGLANRFYGKDNETLKGIQEKTAEMNSPRPMQQPPQTAPAAGQFSNNPPAGAFRR